MTVPLSLTNQLLKAGKQSGTELVFPSPTHPKRRNYGGDAPDAHHLELCKEITLRAKLNCNNCRDSRGERCSNHPVREHWFLHKLPWSDFEREAEKAGREVTYINQDMA